MIDFQFGTVPLEVGSGSIMKNTTRSSLGDMRNSTLPPYLTCHHRERSIGVRYADVELVAHVFKVCERVKTSNGPSNKLLSVDSATRYTSTLFGKF